MKFYKALIQLFGICTLAGLSACGDSGGGATAITRFSNDTGTLLHSLSLLNPIFSPMTATEAPASFEMKLITVYLTEDIGADQSNSGKTAFIYLNPDCEDDISHCDISGGDAEDGSPMDKIVTSYFDFGADSAAVNTAVNAQSRSIDAGSYKYVRMEFCKYNNENAPNIKWTPDGGSELEIQRNTCTVNSTEISPALEVAEGDSVTVTLAYDLSATVTTGLSTNQGDGCDGGTSGSIKCFQLPTFVPTATK